MSTGRITVGINPAGGNVIVIVTSDDFPTRRFAMTGGTALSIAGSLLDCVVLNPGADTIDVHFPSMPEKIAASPDNIRTLARTIATAADQVLDLPNLGADAA